MRMLDVLIVVLVLGTLVALGAYHTPHETPGYPALTDESADLLVESCTHIALPNYQDPPCLIRQDDEVHGLSILANGRSDSGQRRGHVISFSITGDNNFSDDLLRYTKYPRGEHIFRKDPLWPSLLVAFRNGGKLQSSTAP
jgi:hypothetical protein